MVRRSIRAIGRAPGRRRWPATALIPFFFPLRPTLFLTVADIVPIVLRFCSGRQASRWRPVRRSGALAIRTIGTPQNFCGWWLQGEQYRPRILAGRHARQLHPAQERNRAGLRRDNMHPALTEGRAAVITGGASGIGLAAAKRFASLGMKICLADLSQDALDRAAAEMPGATVITVPTDVSKMDEVLRLKERAYAAFGGVAVLMNNAGTSPTAGSCGRPRTSSATARRCHAGIRITPTNSPNF